MKKQQILNHVEKRFKQGIFIGFLIGCITGGLLGTVLAYYITGN